MTGPAHDIASTMWAIRLHAAGGPKQLMLLNGSREPSLEGGEALVRVNAAAITKDELDWPDELPAMPSWELSGEVAAISPDVDTFAVGDGVWALAGFGRDGAAAE